MTDWPGILTDMTDYPGVLPDMTELNCLVQILVILNEKSLPFVFGFMF